MLTPSTLTIAQGATGTCAVATTLVSGAVQQLEMTIGPLPVGAKAWFTPPIVPVGLDSTLHIATFNVTPGTYQVTVEVVGRAVQGGGLMYLNNGPKFNLLAGTGVEVQVVPHFSITADWRMTFAKPFYLGDSLLKSQLMLGVMLHTW